MTNGNRTAQGLPALIEERRRYEAWLAALDARRDSTPQHIFERVRADYQGRLRQVEAELSAHHQAIVEERASIESRLSLLGAEEQLRRDERAELELRAHVGELAGAAADEAFQVVDEAINRLATERRDLGSRLRELDELLASRAAHAPGRATAAAAVEAVISIEALAPQPLQHPPHPPHPQHPLRPAAPPPDDRIVLDGNALQSSGETFDELAFLNTVVNDADSRGSAAPVPAAHPPREDPASAALLSDLAKPGARRSGEAPLGANVPGHTPIILRTTGGAIEQSKTLKCAECGAMNYPTEWYCERCGAELAAL